MREVVLPEELVSQLQEIYQQLEEDYDRIAKEIDFSCASCPDNCCDSYFLHHTYAEWAYLWLGFSLLEKKQQDDIVEKSKDYLAQCEVARNADQRPQVMCPLNDQGLCVLYKHRLLVCRTHGVPATMTRPDGQSMSFPGCFRCQDIVKEKYDKGSPPHVERTPLLRRLVVLENELLENKRHMAPKVKISIAEMIVKGPPSLPGLHCER